tara:strand:- start:112 stop:528 length:417 start_codon:yes stop_codon:yes gene_type:complete
MSDTDKAEIRRLLQLLDSVTEARNRAESQRDAFTDLYRTASRERDNERDNALLIQRERDDARKSLFGLAAQLVSVNTRLAEIEATLSPATQRGRPETSEGSQDTQSPAITRKDGENPFIEWNGGECPYCGTQMIAIRN